MSPGESESTGESDKVKLPSEQSFHLSKRSSGQLVCLPVAVYSPKQIADHMFKVYNS